MLAVRRIGRRRYAACYARRERGERPTASLPGLLAVLLMGWLVLGMGGCGVKGPPVPFRQPAPLPAVAHLGFGVADGRVTLTWRLKAPLDGEAARQARFIVRRSLTKLEGPACENCPMVFETVGTQPYVETADGIHAMTLPLETGYRYGFIVHLKTGKRVGPDSTPVQFDYPSDEVVVPVEEP